MNIQKSSLLYLILMAACILSACASPTPTADTSSPSLPSATTIPTLQAAPPATQPQPAPTKPQEQSEKSISPKALAACEGKKEQDACTFSAPDEEKSGTCTTIQNQLACQPGQKQANNNPQKPQQPTEGAPAFTMEQTLSDKAQEMTIAFDGLAFLTGTIGSDSFFPPGKVADFWGFQYLRDNDPSSMGHNTDFLTSASLNMLKVLSASQKQQLITLAKSQVNAINDYGYKRFVLMTAFRRMLENDLPAGTTGLNEDAVKSFSAELYGLDGQISLERAQVMGDILHNLSTDQRAYLDGMAGKGMTSWPQVSEPDELRPLNHDEKVAVMTYAGDLYSWYAGSLEADIYFCPERQGTYFGSFYMKDAPAVGNPGYSIGTNITADLGQAFLDALDPTQAGLVSGLVNDQRPYLEKIVTVRGQVSGELRKYISGESADAEAVASLMQEYGSLDGAIVYQFATNFARVGQSLTEEQRANLLAMRQNLLGNLSLPEGAYLYAQAIPQPATIQTDFLFK